MIIIIYNWDIHSLNYQLDYFMTNGEAAFWHTHTHTASFTGNITQLDRQYADQLPRQPVTANSVYSKAKIN